MRRTLLRCRSFICGASALLAGCHGLLNECAELGQPGHPVDDGSLDAERTVMRVPNGYAMRIARRDPSRLAWAASIHP